MSIKIQATNGKIHIENDVIATVVGGSAIESPGVVGMASKNAFRDGLNQVLNRENYSKGVVVKQDDNGISVDVYIVAQYGTKLSEVSKSVQSKVKYSLDSMLGIRPNIVNVIVSGVKLI